MQDIDSLRARLSREEAELKTARLQIDEAHHRIQELRKHADSLEKRIKLLREYIELADSGGSDPGLASLLSEGDESFEKQLEAASQEQPTPPPKTASEPNEKKKKPKPDLIDEDGEPLLAELETVATPSPSPGPPRKKEMPVSFDEDIDERQLADEILPRAESFEEALLFLMAHHRKRITPQGIIAAFRRLDYAPNVQATKEAIAARMEQQPTFFAHAGKEGFVLTNQGREEAERLLSQLAI